jgi:hypothetical protein
MLRANFDFSKIHTPGSELSGAALSVLEVEEIQGTLFHNRWLPAERDLALSDARLLRDRAARLLAIARKEEGLELAIVDVALTPVPTRAKPAANNQLGTLNPVEGSQFRAVLTA